jgi:hypothetical protein
MVFCALRKASAGFRAAARFLKSFDYIEDLECCNLLEVKIKKLKDFFNDTNTCFRAI